MKPETFNENIDLEKSFKKFNELDETEVQERRMEEKHKNLDEEMEVVVKEYGEKYMNFLEKFYTQHK